MPQTAERKRQYLIESAPRRKAYAKIWREKNREKLNAYFREYRKSDKAKEYGKLYQRERRKRQPDVMKAMSRRYHGLPEPTRPEPDNCECCGLVFEKTGMNVPCLDHCHETGAFRGWLCFRCNTAIGKLGDNLAGLERAIAYLRKAQLVGA